MRRIISIVLAFSLILSFSVISYADDSVSSTTSFVGLTGHAGIAISSLHVIHIEGPGHHPATLKLSDWNEKYSINGRWTRIYRHNSAGTALQAGEWAEKTYKNSNASYVINADLSSTSKTYCSKIVWQAYHYGPNSPVSTTPVSGIVLPYSLPDLIRSVRLVKTYQN